VFLDWWKGSYYGTANELGALVEAVSGDGLKPQTIANRGVKVYPDGMPDTFTVDHWRYRFVAARGRRKHGRQKTTDFASAKIGRCRIGRYQNRKSLQLRRRERLFSVRREG